MGRIRTPTVLQMEAAECGAACLAILLRHYGRVVSPLELRQVCGVTRDGSDAASLRQLDRRHHPCQGFDQIPSDAMPPIRDQERRVRLHEIAADHDRMAVPVAQDEVVATPRICRAQHEFAAVMARGPRSSERA